MRTMKPSMGMLRARRTIVVVAPTPSSKVNSTILRSAFTTAHRPKAL